MNVGVVIQSPQSSECFLSSMHRIIFGQIASINFYGPFFHERPGRYFSGNHNAI